MSCGYVCRSSSRHFIKTTYLSLTAALIISMLVYYTINKYECISNYCLPIDPDHFNVSNTFRYAYVCVC